MKALGLSGVLRHCWGFIGFRMESLKSTLELRFIYLDKDGDGEAVDDVGAIS